MANAVRVAPAAGTHIYVGRHRYREQDLVDLPVDHAAIHLDRGTAVDPSKPPPAPPALAQPAEEHVAQAES